jgi:beta-lactamase class A
MSDEEQWTSERNAGASLAPTNDNDTTNTPDSTDRPMPSDASDASTDATMPLVAMTPSVDAPLPDAPLLPVAPDEWPQPKAPAATSAAADDVPAAGAPMDAGNDAAEGSPYAHDAEQHVQMPSSPAPTADAAPAALGPDAASALPDVSDAPTQKTAAATTPDEQLDERVVPLRLTPFQRPRRAPMLVWGGLAGAALLLLLPALLASVLWPALGLASPFGGPPDHIPRGASAWANATAITPLADADASFGAQTYPVDAQFAAGYAARGGQSTLGAAVTPAFTCNLGLVQFFANGALLRTSGTKPAASATSSNGLDPDLMSDGDRDSINDAEWLPLSHTLLAGGSAAPIGGAGSALTYAKLRAATLPVALVPQPTTANHIKANAPLPQAIVIGGTHAFIVEGSHGGKLVGHSIPAPIWAYINQTQIAPHGWQRDIGEPLTEPLSVTVNDSSGQPHHLLAQAFWQTIIVSDLDSRQATAMEPIGLDYLHTFGAPAAHPTAGGRLWTTQDGALRSAPGASALAVSLNTNAPVTLTGAAQWSQGALWYAATWSSPSRNGSAWVAASALSSAQSSGPATAGFDALSPSLASYLSGQGDDVGAVAYDITRNTLYTYRPDNTFIMASSAKVPLMVSYLTMIESQNRGPNSYEMSVLTAMIEHSDNNAAQVIYDTIGDDSGQQSYMHAWGISNYSPNPNGWGWGRWSSGDMAHLLALLQSGSVLNSADRALAFHLMQSVESDQRFGVGDTAPANATVAMKDGWVPGPDGAWAVNTSGIVTVGGETYIVTVYTGEQGSYSSGVSIVNHVCGAIAQALK